MPVEVREGTEVLDTGLQTARKEQIAAREDREVMGVLEETVVAWSWRLFEFVPVTGGVGLSWDPRPIQRSKI